MEYRGVCLEDFFFSYFKKIIRFMFGVAISGLYLVLVPLSIVSGVSNLECGW